MTKEDFKKIKLTPEEFYEGAKPSTLFKEVTEEIRKESAKHLIDPVWAKRCRDWNKVANKIVGCE